MLFEVSLKAEGLGPREFVGGDAESDAPDQGRKHRVGIGICRNWGGGVRDAWCERAGEGGERPERATRKERSLRILMRDRFLFGAGWGVLHVGHAGSGKARAHAAMGGSVTIRGRKTTPRSAKRAEWPENQRLLGGIET